MKADYFVLLSSFTLNDCQYFTEKCLSSFKPKMLFELIKYMNENNRRFLSTTREEKNCLGLENEVTPTNLSGSNTFLIRSCFNFFPFFSTFWQIIIKNTNVKCSLKKHNIKSLLFVYFSIFSFLIYLLMENIHAFTNKLEKKKYKNMRKKDK